MNSIALIGRKQGEVSFQGSADPAQKGLNALSSNMGTEEYTESYMNYLTATGGNR